jgi:putative peptidoglycan lipid II flippase
VPITAVMMPLSPILAAVLFGFGAANRESAFLIGYTVIGMLIGLVPFSIYFILLRGWYSLEDTRTPFYLSLVLNTINVALSIALFNLAPTSLKVPAIGLAFGLTYWIMMPIAWPILSRRSNGLHTRSTWVAILKMLAAGTATVVVTWLCYWGLEQVLGSAWESRLSLVGVLVVASLLGLVSYLAVARALGIREVSAAVSLVRRRVGH